MIYLASILLPFIGAIVTGLFVPLIRDHELRDRAAHVVTCGLMLIAGWLWLAAAAFAGRRANP